MHIPYLLTGAALFAIGLIGFITRKNLIIIFLCTELMFHGIIVNLVGLGRFPFAGQAGVEGQLFSLFLLAVAASEAALGLALVVLLFRHRESLDANAWRTLRDD